MAGTKLFPCPFCGGEAETRTSTRNDKNYKWTVQCKTNLCMGEMGCAFYRTEAEAIEAWNTRAERTCHFIENYGEGCWSKEHRDGKCSICGEEMKGRYNYCPECGAKVVNE